MQLTFLGATKTVTGSCFLIETKKSKVLVDCGMFQGSKFISNFNRQPFRFIPTEIDAVLLTHAHIDHSGLLPKLSVSGFKGPIYSTKVTEELCSILLPDSAYIQEMEAENTSRRRRRAGRELITPLYTMDQAYETLKQFRVCNYGIKHRITDDIEARFSVAGHIMGAAVVEVFVTEDDETIKLLFSGDLGHQEQPIVKDPKIIDSADYVIIESTYGNREHNAYEPEKVLGEAINDTYARGGNVIIPAFAVGRTQVLLYYLQRLLQNNEIPSIPIIIDSPLASKATEIIFRNPQEFDEEGTELYNQYKNNMLEIPQVRFTQSVEESRALNFATEPMIIISASGMADAGRVRHHLKHNLWREESSVIFVGYQAQGTIGRNLVEGAKRIRMFGEDISVKAKIYNMEVFSAHADKNQLINWVEGIKDKPKSFFIVHGEINAARNLATEINYSLGVNTYIPDFADVAILNKDGWKVKESQIITDVPAINDLREELKDIETQYFRYKTLMEHRLSENPEKIKEFRRRINKVTKYMSNEFNNL